MKLYIDRKLNIDEQKSRLLAEFCLFCADYLPIEGEFNIHVVSDRKPHGISTTAAYLVGENSCAVYGKNRALPDVMRSVAHEMTHMMQDQIGLINGPTRDAGGFHEDQANARAGELLKRFVSTSPARKVIYERRKRDLF
jgi:hypothetical protein